MRLACLAFSMFFTVTYLFAQEPLPPQEILQGKLDSIINEANQLFYLENAARIATEKVASKKYLKKDIGHYVSYFDGDTIVVIFTGRLNPDLCIYEAKFLSNPFTFISESFSQRNLEVREHQLIKLKNSMVNYLTKNLQHYSFVIPQNMELTYIILPYGQFFKFYVLTVSRVQNVVPFGNDGLFIIDAHTNIIAWRKFHKSFIPLRVTNNPERQVVSYTHSHLPEEPFITATDICMFRLYSDLHKLKEFRVYSSYYKKYFIYSLEDNKIRIQEYSAE